ncbi:hypothetical protein ALC60_06997, partial [Trachymyrmex zeteki]
IITTVLERLHTTKCSGFRGRVCILFTVRSAAPNDLFFPVYNNIPNYIMTVRRKNDFVHKRSVTAEFLESLSRLKTVYPTKLVWHC